MVTLFSYLVPVKVIIIYDISFIVSPYTVLLTPSEDI